MQVGLASLVDPELAKYVDESRAFNAAAEAGRAARAQLDPSTPEGLHESRTTLTPRPAPDGPPAVEQLAEAAGRQVAVRIFVPRGRAPCGVYLDIHGGGFYMGWAARDDARNRLLADALGAAVVSVDYRLAPEHPWPAAPDDCETAALWLLERAETSFGTARLAIGGSSAGATLAMATLLRLRDRGLSGAFVGAALQFGTYDLSAQTPAGRRIAGEFFIDAYAGHVADRTNPDISPLYGDLSDLPPALLVVGSLDVVLEESIAMAARLSAAGGEVDLRVYPESVHGFTSSPTSMAGRALRDIESWLTDRFLHSAAPTRRQVSAA